MTNHNEVEIDPVLHALGPVGLFACVQCLVYFSGYLTGAHQFFAYVFIAKNVGHRCAAPGNDSDVIIPELHDRPRNTTQVHYGQCSISVSTNVSGNITVTDYDCVYGMEYDDPKEFSLVSEFDLVCERKALAGLTQTVTGLGYGVGCTILPWISDLYGRKRVILISMFLMTLASLFAGLAPNYAALVVAKLIIGAIAPGIGLIGVTAGIELFPSSHRVFISGFCSTFFWAACITTVPLVAYLLRFHSWRTLQMVFSASCGLFVFLLFVKEPVLWLVANGKIKEAEKALIQAARWNGKDVDTVLNVFRELGLHQHHHTAPVTSADGNPVLPSTDGDTVQDDPVTKTTNAVSTQPEDKDLADTVKAGHLGFRDLARHKILRRNILVNLLIWFVVGLTYNALYLLSDTMAFNLYLNFFLNAVVEGASCVLMVLMMNRAGRKVMLGVFHILAGVGLIASGVCFYFQDNSTLQVAGTMMSLVGKMGIGGAFNALYLYTPEIFPTNVRNRALGISSIANTVGGMVAPYSDVLVDQAVWAPGVLFGTLSMCMVLALRALPESRGKELPTTIRDLEAWYHVTSADNKDNPSSKTSGVINLSYVRTPSE